MDYFDLSYEQQKQIDRKIRSAELERESAVDWVYTKFCDTGEIEIEDEIEAKEVEKIMEYYGAADESGELSKYMESVYDSDVISSAFEKAKSVFWEELEKNRETNVALKYLFGYYLGSIVVDDEKKEVLDAIREKFYEFDDFLSQVDDHVEDLLVRDIRCVVDKGDPDYEKSVAESSIYYRVKEDREQAFNTYFQEMHR